MLSDKAIEKLIQPIINRQININNYVIGIIAKRIKEIGEILPSDLYKLEALMRSGNDVQKINKEIAILTNRQISDIKHIIQEVALDSYIDMKRFYDYRMIPFIPFKENVELQKVVKSIATQTSNTYRNLSKAQAFMIRDLKNPKILRPTSISDTYKTIVDEAVQANQTAGIDYKTAMRRSLRQLVDSGIRNVSYNTESGRVYTQRLDTAVRRNILDGIRAINQGVQNETGKQFGADGVEITVHEYPAEDHAPVQGHQFTLEEYAKISPVPSIHPDNSIDTSHYEKTDEVLFDVEGRQYEVFERKIGTLNCRHFTFSIIIGVFPPNYTDEELQQILDRNEEGYELPNGKKLTMYQCTQKQREMETKIRWAKDGQMAAETAGDNELANEYQAKVNKYEAEYREFSKACGLTVKHAKTYVDGYKKIY